MVSYLEFRRGLFHLISGVIIVILIRFEFLTKWALLVITAASLALSFACKNHKIPILYWFLEKFDRERDIKKFPGKGAIFFLIGATVVMFAASTDIALASIIILAVADPISRFVGVKFGKIRHPFNDVKFTEGAVAGIAAGFLAAMIFVSPAEAFLASFFAMVAEGVELKLGMRHVDDNIIIPVVAAAVIMVMRFLA